jgi:PEGA domain
MTRILALLCLLCGIARADVDPKRKVIVLEYRSGSSAMPHVADRIVAMLSKQTSLNVLGPDQTRAVYGEHLDLVIVKCAGDPECVARIGQKVGAAEVILVGISELGDVILTIQRIDVATRTVSSRLADSISGGVMPNDQKLDGYLKKLLPASDFLRYGVIDIISSESGALVTIGGQHRGSTPIPSLKLKAPANYDIRVEKRGFQPFTTSVQLPPDSELRVRANLARPGGAPSWWQHWYVLAPAALIVAGAAGGSIYFATEQTPTAGPLKGVGSIQ